MRTLKLTMRRLVRRLREIASIAAPAIGQNNAREIASRAFHDRRWRWPMALSVKRKWNHYLVLGLMKNAYDAQVAAAQIDIGSGNVLQCDLISPWPVQHKPPLALLPSEGGCCLAASSKAVDDVMICLLEHGQLHARLPDPDVGGIAWAEVTLVRDLMHGNRGVRVAASQIEAQVRIFQIPPDAHTRLCSNGWRPPSDDRNITQRWVRGPTEIEQVLQESGVGLADLMPAAELNVPFGWEDSE